MGRRSSVWYWLAFLGLTGALAFYVEARGLQDLYYEYEETGQQIEAWRQQVDVRKAEEARLHHRVDNLESDPVEMEAAIRQRKNLVRPGETIYRVELADD